MAKHLLGWNMSWSSTRLCSRPLLFLIYINDFPENLVSVTKLFADDTSIFSTVIDVNKCGQDLNRDLLVIKDWAFRWRTAFNPDPNKQATEIVLSPKKETGHPCSFAF